MKNKKLLLILYLFIFFALSYLYIRDIKYQGSVVNPILNIPDQLTGNFIGKYLSYVEDVDCTYTIDNIINDKNLSWKKGTEDHFTFGFTKSVYWLRLDVNNTMKQPIDFYIEYDYACIDEVFFYPKKNKIIQKGGDGLPFNVRPINHNKPLFMVKQFPGVHTYYFRVNNDGSLHIKIKVWNENEFHKYTQDSNLWYGIYIGIMILLSLFNFFLYVFSYKNFLERNGLLKSFFNFIFFRYKNEEFPAHEAFFFLCILSLSALYHSSYYTGISYQYLWSSYPIINNKLFCVNELITNLSVVLILRNFDSIKKNLLYITFLKWLLRIGCAFIIIALVVPYLWAMQFVTLYNLICLLVGIPWATIILWETKSGKYFSCIMLIFTMAAFIEFFQSVNFILSYSNWIAWGLRSVSIGMLSVGILLYILKMLYTEIQEQEDNYLQLLIHSQKAETTFTQQLAHELSTPVETINWVIDDLSDLNLESEVKENIRVISEEVNNINYLTQNFLNITRLDSKKLKPVYEEEDLKVIINDAIELLKNFNNEPDHNHQIIFPDRESPVKYVTSIDKQQILFVFKNILENAIKYTPPNGKIFVLIQRKEHQIEVCIADNGDGIPPQAIGKVFTAFFQASLYQNKRVGGVGLGLAIAKRIIQEHNGQIICNSPISPEEFPELSLKDNQKGTVFKIYIPVIKNRQNGQ